MVFSAGVAGPLSIADRIGLFHLNCGSPGAAILFTPGLTAREDEVLSLMRRGMTNKQIAERLDISVNTVKKHLAHLFAKYGLHGRRQQIA